MKITPTLVQDTLSSFADKGVNLTSCDSDGHFQIVEFLIERLIIDGQSSSKVVDFLNLLNNDGETSLYLAAENNYPTILKLLIDNGANPDYSGNITSIHRACLQGNLNRCKRSCTRKS
ncbi:MAG: ankyrin repeat domain-containing protein [Colwellia sp.]|nr:ankyrin repeat domain-containing protein [Colwellia sp.]